MKLETFFEIFDHFTDAPGAVAKMRELVLELAVQGRLLPQEPNDEPATILLERIHSDQTGTTKSRKARRKDSAAEINAPHELPMNWTWTSLGSIADWGSGSTPPRGNYELYGGNITWLKSGELNDNRALVGSEERVTELALKQGSFRQNQPGDVLFAMYGATVGKAAILAEPAVTNQAVCGCTPCAGILSDYLFFYLVSQRQKFRNASEGGAQPNFSKDKIVTYPFPLPPLAEQKRIVAKVDELMALCDRLEAQQQAREEQSSQLARASLVRFATAPTPANLNYLFHPSYNISPSDLRKSILTLAVQGKLVPQNPKDEPASGLVVRIMGLKQSMIEAKTIRQGKVSRPHTALAPPKQLPPGWVWLNVDSLCYKVTDGTHLTPQYAASGVRFVSAKDIVRGKLEFDRCKFITREEHEQLYRRCNPEFHDIVISKSGSIGTVALIEDRDEFSLFESLALLKFDKNSLFPPFLVFALTNACSSLTAGHIRGVGVKHLHLDILRGLELALPPLPEQRRIVAKVSQLMTLVDELETHLTTTRTTAQNLLSALVADLTASCTDDAA